MFLLTFSLHFLIHYHAVYTQAEQITNTTEVNIPVHVNMSIPELLSNATQLRQEKISLSETFLEEGLQNGTDMANYSAVYHRLVEVEQRIQEFEDAVIIRESSYRYLWPCDDWRRLRKHINDKKNEILKTRFEILEEKKKSVRNMNMLSGRVKETRYFQKELTDMEEYISELEAQLREKFHPSTESSDKIVKPITEQFIT